MDSKLFTLEKVHTDDNGTDMFTKEYIKEKFFFVDKIRVWWSPPRELEGEIVGWASLFVGQPT